MKKVAKIALSAIAGVVIVGLVGAYGVYAVRGSLKSVPLTEEFQTGIAAADNAIPQEADARIMSSNLLVHYPSWGGTPAKPRAQMFLSILKTYKPDVVGLQEISDEWFACLNRNLPDGYRFLFPFTTGLFVNMTGMIYNSNTVNLLDSGKVAYSQGDNPRLRRVVWGLFEQKSDGKKYVVTSTHFDLIRENKEDAQYAIMETQANELLQLMNDLEAKFQCPVFATGDFNAMDNGGLHGQYDAPGIYEKLEAALINTKNAAETKYSGSAQGLDVPTYDHVFLKGQAQIKAYAILSDPYVTPLSDHYPIFADVTI